MKKHITNARCAVALAIGISLLTQSFLVTSVKAQGDIIGMGQQPKFCPFFYGGSSQPYVGGYMTTDYIEFNPTWTDNQGYPSGRGLSTYVTFVGTTQSIIQSDNFLAAGIVGQGWETEVGAPSIDYGYSLALVLDGPSSIYIEGAVWACYEWGKNGNWPWVYPPAPEADLVFSFRWWCPGLSVNSQVWLAMQWNSNSLDYLAKVGGVQYTLISYAPVPYESPHFMLGTKGRSFPIPLGGTIKFFQFVGAASNYPIMPVGGYPPATWHSKVTNPSFMWTNESSWRPIDYAYATQGEDAWLDQTCLWGHGSYNVDGHYYYDGNYDEVFGNVEFYPSQSQMMPTDIIFWDKYAPRYGGCPYVSVWNGTQYVLDNNVLPGSEKNAHTGIGTDVKDSYRLEQALVRDAGKYSLLLSEFEQEHSYIDQVKLSAIDHSADVRIAVTPDGEILTYKDPVAPISAVDGYGNDRLSEISLMDGDVLNPATYYYGEPGDSLTLNFGQVSSDVAKLIMRVDWIKERVHRRSNSQ